MKFAKIGTPNVDLGGGGSEKYVRTGGSANSYVCVHGGGGGGVEFLGISAYVLNGWSLTGKSITFTHTHSPIRRKVEPFYSVPWICL